MSSTEASDLVDSDEDGSAPAPTPSPSRKRLFRVGCSPSSTGSLGRRAAGTKRSCLELEGGDDSTTGTPGRAKGDEVWWVFAGNYMCIWRCSRLAEQLQVSISCVRDRVSWCKRIDRQHRHQFYLPLVYTELSTYHACVK